MSMETLKTKLHALFENCGLKHEEKTVKEDAVPSPQPVKQEYKSPTGIVYDISADKGVVNVSDKNGTVVDSFTADQANVDGKLKKEERTAIASQLGIALQQAPQTPATPPAQTPAATPSQPSTPTEPVEAPVAEGKLEEVDEKVAKKFKDQYGDKWKEIYYATANAQDRNPETFEKK